MERSLLKEMNKANLTAFINRQQELLNKRLFWSVFFVLKFSPQLTWESLSGSSGTPVMADVIEYNASAPIKSRRTVRKETGDIPKIALKRKMDEKDYNDYLYLTTLANDTNKKDILKIVFDDPTFVYEGVLARCEFLCLQALSYGKITLDATNNNGIITETAVDFGIPEANKTAVGTIWATAASATPIANIRAKVAAMEENGHSCRYIIMDKATYLLMVATTEVKDAYAFYQGVGTGRIAVPSIDGVNAMLAAEMLPTIMIVDSNVRHETMAHVLSNIKPWKTGYVTFVPTVQVGKLYHGNIAEANSAALQKVAVMATTEHVLVTKWSELEPFGEFTKGQANAFPGFDDVNSIYILRTNGTSWA